MSRSHLYFLKIGMYTNATVEKSVGGPVVTKRFLAGNSLSRDGTASEGRSFFFTFRLEGSLVQTLNVSKIP